MKNATLFFLLFMSLVASGPVLADGMFYWSESIPLGIPYQRALLWFDGERETLLLQSKYHAPTAPGERFGWVVPVPAVPELASMDPSLANSLFRRADSASEPAVVPGSILLMIALLLAVHAPALLTLLACLLSLFVARLSWVRQHRAALVAGSLLVLLPFLGLLADMIWEEFVLFFGSPVIALLVFLICVFSRSVRQLAHRRGVRRILIVSALLSLVAFVVIGGSIRFLQLGAHQGMSDAIGIEIVEATQVGIYDVQVVRAEEADRLIGWLNGNQFHFDETDQEVFDDYLRRSWCFVVAQVDPARADEGAAAYEGLVAPLILRFAADAPVYPLALTATAGQKTEILIYLFSQEKWASDGRLKLHYAAGGKAGMIRLRDTDPAYVGFEPHDFFAGDELALPYLCKFKGTLTAEQMRQDLVFTPAEDQEPYRKRIFVW